MNRYMYDIHVGKYMYLQVHTLLILVECVSGCSQNHGCQRV